jgi:2-oxo-4-hydroxy-4-carboxy-5-ureidoimidazoline decarboxylase
MIEPTESELLACLGVQRWAEDVLALSPYESAARLLEVAAEKATPLSPQEIDEAISHHPRIGEAPTAVGTSADFSRNEQAGLGDDDAVLAEQLRSGNQAYEERFGRVFIIRAAGRSRPEILAELERRLELPNATELEIVGKQLREIALLRLEKLYAQELA